MLCCFTDLDLRSRFRVNKIEMLLNDLCNPNHRLVIHGSNTHTHTEDQPLSVFRFVRSVPPADQPPSVFVSVLCDCRMYLSICVLV
ncbi:hypothetical protein Hdeb2414_s0078g00778291 [Helianthus debilis subsp. tardiflorus]